MVRLDYKKEDMQKVSIRGIPCEFYDMRINRETVPQGKFFMRLQMMTAMEFQQGSDQEY